jgi:acyl-CoA synthetase (AMP-forming)/AMP-acid ligase II/pimeloyl-ACP methyl ester carboxylesterase
VPDPPSVADLGTWGLNSAWSKTVDVASHDGGTYRWHVLDTGRTLDAAGRKPVATMVCVHGNPTWGYSWATFLRTFGDRYRVIAVDQLGMGFSERTPLRRYATRVRDLDDVIGALGIDNDLPLTLGAHDWGGAVAMGWAVDHADRVAGMVLCNTGIAVPAGRKAPSIIRLAASPALRDLVCRRTPTFVDGTTLLSRGKIKAADRAAFRAPYSSAAHRAAISDFVGDIPLQPGGGHPSEDALADVAQRLHTIEAPVLLAWGAADPVFNDDFAADLAERLPNTSIQRFPAANHLVMVEADVAGTVDLWLSDRFERPQPAPVASPPASTDRRSLWSALETLRGDDDIAFADMASGARITWTDLADRVDRIATELAARGLRHGDRVAMLTPPGVELAAAIYGVWRAGGVAVIADRGLGLSGLRRAVRSARPSWVIGPKQALAAARTLRWAPRARGIDINDLMSADASVLPNAPGADDLAAILFTSGATGPAKGVRYRHHQLEAQRDALAAAYSITSADRLLAAFAPFALYGPALGISTVLPDCDVTTPGKLTAAALSSACAELDATLAFASPAALANVVATSGNNSEHGPLERLRLIMSAGAPVPAETLAAVGALAPNAALHTPYGMTEVLPVADIDLAAIEAATTDEPAGGVCVGHPVEGATVMILPLDFDPAAPPAAAESGVTGEILVNAPWVSDGYLGLWATERSARPDLGDGQRWHRSGDVGHLDTEGRLWVEGRAVHNVHTSTGVVTSVPVERMVERELGLTRVAAVGVGPHGCQQLVVVLEDSEGINGLASTDLAARIRSTVDHQVAAVLTLRAMPVDIRHNAKIDRTAVAAWAEDVLAGRRATAPGARRLPGRR